MTFDNNKIEFLKRINLPIDSKERLKDINTFFEYFCEIQEKFRGCPARLLNDYEKNGLDLIGPDFYIIKTPNANAPITLGNKSVSFKNSEAVFSKTVSFLELLEFLEENKLIKIIEKDPNDIKNFAVPLLDYTVKFGINYINPIDNKLWLLIKNYVLIEIIPQSNLNDFINKGCKIMENGKNRKKLPIKLQRILQKEINSVCPIPDCNSKDVDHFQIHHIDEDKSNNDLINLIMLCPTCHSKVTKKDILQENIIALKNNLMKKEIKYKIEPNNHNIININSGIKESVIANVVHNITIKGKSKPKLNHPKGSIGTNLTMRNYIKHLIDRYQEYMKGDTTKNEKTKYAIIYNAIKKEFVVDKYTFVHIDKFYDLISFLQMRIDKTIIGKRNVRKGVKNYSSLQEYLSQQNLIL